MQRIQTVDKASIGIRRIVNHISRYVDFCCVTKDADGMLVDGLARRAGVVACVHDGVVDHARDLHRAIYRRRTSNQAYPDAAHRGILDNIAAHHDIRETAGCRQDDAAGRYCFIFC